MSEITLRVLADMDTNAFQGLSPYVVQDQVRKADARIAQLETELAACRRVVDAAMDYRNQMLGIGERGPMDYGARLYAAIESHASDLPKEEKPACPTCGGTGRVDNYPYTGRPCPACTQAQGGE